ncbi:MAG: hypothetical protein KatS3mg060_1158 [Dehalococcoidia bacterium]|nr:MAG: hypothetical protein KatS3mg060_1158 [Dehalococcoidia bacterium]
MLSRDASGKWIVPTPDGTIIEADQEETAREVQLLLTFVQRVRDVATRLQDVHRDIRELAEWRDTLDLQTSAAMRAELTKTFGLTPQAFWQAFAEMEQQARPPKAARALLLRLARPGPPMNPGMRPF